MEYKKLTMRHIGAFLYATKQDEMQVLLHLCQFDHATAFVLRELLVRGAGYEGFWHTAEQWYNDLKLSRHLVNKAHAIIADLGITTETRPIGKNGLLKATHYTVDVLVFWDALITCVATRLNKPLAEVQNIYSSALSKCEKFTPRSAKNSHVEVQNFCNASLDKDSDNKDSQNRLSQSEPERRESYILDASGELFSSYKKHREALNEAVKQLGEGVVREAIAFAQTRQAVDWLYVVNNLARAKPKASPLNPRSNGRTMSEREQAEIAYLKTVGKYNSWEEGLGMKPPAVDYTPEELVKIAEGVSYAEIFKQRYIANDEAYRRQQEAEQASEPIAQSSPVWETAYRQLELRLDRNTFGIYLEGARFIGMDGDTFFVWVKKEAVREALQGRYYRTVKGTLSNVVGREVEIRFTCESLAPV